MYKNNSNNNRLAAVINAYAPCIAITFSVVTFLCSVSVFFVAVVFFALALLVTELRCNDRSRSYMNFPVLFLVFDLS